MSGLVKGIFGGTDKSAQKAQIAQNAQDRQLFAQLTDESRGDATVLMPAADDNRNMGFQAAMDLLSGNVNKQIDPYQQGNMGAQQQLLAGLPMIQQAILGGRIDFSQLQPTQVRYDTGSLQNVKLPDFKSSTDALKVEQPKAPDLSQLLSSYYGRAM